MSAKSECVEVEMGIRLPSGAFIRNIFKRIEDIPTIRKRYKNRGVYVSAYRYTNAREKDQSLLYGNLYIDLDIADLKEEDKAEEAFEKIREDGIKVISFFSVIFGIEEMMIKIYYSGQKGLHIIVPARILGIKPMTELNHVFRLIAKEIHNMSKHKTIDTQIYDNARLFSLPGVIHPDTGRHKIPLTFQELRHLSFQEIKKLSCKKRKIEYEPPYRSTKAHRVFQSYIDQWEKEKREQKKKDKKGYDKTLSFCPPCIQSILERPCPQGVRNNTAAVLSSYFKQRGYSKDKGWKLLQEWNSRYAKLPVRELEITFESIYSGDYTYGCSTLETLGDCQMKECKIGRARLENQEKKKEELNREQEKETRRGRVGGRRG